MPGVARHLTGRDQERHGDRQIEPRSFLAQVARREVHDHPTQRPCQARVLDRGADPLARVLDGRPREPREGQRRQAAPNEGLDGDEVATHPEHRHAEHPSVHVVDATGDPGSVP
jgi:hypothetical protein